MNAGGNVSANGFISTNLFNAAGGSFYISSTAGYHLRLWNNAMFAWTNSSDASGGSITTNLNQISAGVLGLGTTTANTSGELRLTNLVAGGTLAVAGATTLSSRLNLASYTVGTLPAAGAAGGVIYVSDAAEMVRVLHSPMEPIGNAATRQTPQ